MLCSEMQDIGREFASSPERRDSALLKAYRRLEMTARQRSGAVEHGDLWGGIFGKQAKLRWPSLPEDKTRARMQLFQGAVGAFRNLRGHKEGVEEGFASNELILLDLLSRLLAAAEQPHHPMCSETHRNERDGADVGETE